MKITKLGLLALLVLATSASGQAAYADCSFETATHLTLERIAEASRGFKWSHYGDLKVSESSDPTTQITEVLFTLTATYEKESPSFQTFLGYARYNGKCTPITSLIQNAGYPEVR